MVWVWDRGLFCGCGIVWVGFGGVSRIASRVEPAHVRQLAFYVAADSDQLGGDRDSDLFWSDSADVEANGSVHVVEEMGGETLVL